MANAKVEIVGEDELTLVAELYGRVFKPANPPEFFKRRFLGRHNPLMLIASLGDRPVGFFVGFELKPNVFYAWLYGVVSDFRRQGVATQLLEAAHAWAKDHGYEYVRLECHNQHRATLHMVISHGYDIVGLRWDPDRSANLVICEKLLEE